MITSDTPKCTKNVRTIKKRTKSSKTNQSRKHNKPLYCNALSNMLKHRKTISTFPVVPTTKKPITCVIGFFARCVPLRERDVHFVRDVHLRCVMCPAGREGNTSHHFGTKPIHHYAVGHNITDLRSKSTPLFTN